MTDSYGEMTGCDGLCKEVSDGLPNCSTVLPISTVNTITVYCVGRLQILPREDDVMFDVSTYELDTILWVLSVTLMQNGRANPCVWMASLDQEQYTTEYCQNTL